VFYGSAAAEERQKRPAYDFPGQQGGGVRGLRGAVLQVGNWNPEDIRVSARCILADCLDQHGRHAHCLQHRFHKVVSGDDDLDAGQGGNLRPSEREEARQYFGHGDMRRHGARIGTVSASRWSRGR
jgi:hypothetical protein